MQTIFCTPSGTRTLDPLIKSQLLYHLSKDNNHPELAYKTVEWKLKSKGIIVGKDVQLLALKRNTPSELYEFE